MARRSSILLVGLLVACTSETASPPPAANVPPPAATIPKEPEKQPDPVPEPRRVGEIRLLTYFGGEALVTALFSDEPLVEPKGCTTTTSGSCRLLDCDTQSLARAGLVSAGQLEVYGGTPEVSITVDPEQNVYAASKPAPVGKSFAPKVRVAVRAAGAAVPKFDTTVDFPEVALMTAPALASTAERASDLTVSWTRGAADRVVEVALSGRTAGRTMRITCELPALPGIGKIPTALLAKLPAGAAEISAVTYAKSTATAGLYDVAVRAGSEALTPAQDGAWSGRLTLK